jgi:hypothetical protein
MPTTTVPATTSSPRTGHTRPSAITKSGDVVGEAEAITAETASKPAKKPKRSPEVEAVWSKLDKQIDAAFAALPALAAETVELHRKLRAAINAKQHSLYIAHKEAFPK